MADGTIFVFFMYIQPLRLGLLFLYVFVDVH